MTGASPRTLVIVSFVALTAGFAAGYGLAVREPEPPRGAGGAPPHPVGAQAYIELGMRALQAGDFRDAEERFRAAAEMRPEDPAPHVDLALALLYQRRWQDAERALAMARERDPERPEVDFLEGLLARDGLADTVRAATAWERFLTRVPPDAPQADMVRGWLEELDGIR